MGLKLMTLCHAANAGKDVSVHSRGGDRASVLMKIMGSNPHHPYPVEFTLVFASDGKKYTVYWDQFLQAHILDECDHEVMVENPELEIEFVHDRQPLGCSKAVT